MVAEQAALARMAELETTSATEISEIIVGMLRVSRTGETQSDLPSIYIFAE